MACDQEVMGSNNGTVYWMDLRKIVIKEAKWGTPKKQKNKQLQQSFRQININLL
jgi:hypothetical protein